MRSVVNSRKSAQDAVRFVEQPSVEHNTTKKVPHLQPSLKTSQIRSLRNTPNMGFSLLLLKKQKQNHNLSKSLLKSYNKRKNPRFRINVA